MATTQHVRYPPILTSFSVTATNPSVGTNGATAPTSSTEVGIIDGTGKLQGVSSTNPLPVSSASLPLPTGAATSALQTTGNTALTTINTTLGSPFQAGGSIGNASFGISGTLPAFTAIPTFKIDQTTPGTTNLVSIGTNGTVAINAAIPAGSNIIGNIRIDQTTPGTTNGVQVNNTVAISAPVNANGNSTSTTVSTVATITKPANSIGFLLQNDAASTDYIRWCDSGTVASTTVGFVLQPGQDTGFVPMSHDLKICAHSGTQNYNIQWVLSS